MLQLTTQHSEDVTTIWCKGRIVLGDELHRFKVAILSQNTLKVMLDLSSVNLIDAAGLGALVVLHKRFQCAVKKMELVNPTRFVSQVFGITRLDTVFHIDERTKGSKLAAQVVRCPYCVLGDDFRRMLPRAEGWFICQKCGHTAMPGEPEFRCFCQKCGESNRAA